MDLIEEIITQWLAEVCVRRIYLSVILLITLLVGAFVVRPLWDIATGARRGQTD